MKDFSMELRRQWIPTGQFKVHVQIKRKTGPEEGYAGRLPLSEGKPPAFLISLSQLHFSFPSFFLLSDKVF